MNGSRYHPLLVVLHWLTALLIVGSLAVGWLVLRVTPSADPQKIGVLMAHMAGGAALLALMVLRLAVRLATAKPAVGGARRAEHWALYLLVFGIIATGFATAVLTGLNQVVFGGGGALPPGLAESPARRAHEALAVLLGLLVPSHALAPIRRRLWARLVSGFRTPAGRPGLTSRGA